MDLNFFVATLWAFIQASGYAGHAMVRQHQIRRKSTLLSLSALMVERLIDGAYATIQNSFHAWLSCPLGCRPRGDVSADASLASAVGKAKVFLVPPRLSPCGLETRVIDTTSVVMPHPVGAGADLDEVAAFSKSVRRSMRLLNLHQLWSNAGMP